MPPRKRKEETPAPVPAKTKRSSREAPTKRQTALPVNAPLPDAVTKESTEVPKETSAVKEDSERKTKVHVSSVHKQFIQESVVDENGIKNWSSKCIHCPTGSMKGEFKSKQASHLKMHLKKNHPPIFLMVEDEDQRERDSLQNRVTVKDKQGRCVNKFLDLFSNSGLPLSTADNPYFKDLLKELDPDITFPGRKGTTNLLIKGRFGPMYSKMKSVLARCGVIHATTDMWSNSHCRSSYVGFTVHCYDPVDRVRRNFRLALREFNESHTSAAILKKSVEIFQEFNIKNKASCIHFFQSISYTKLSVL